MNVSDEKIKQDWASVDSENLEQALLYLKKCEIAVNEYLAEAVASLCGVSAKEMMSNTNATYLTRPRWLFWYAYRYMTGDSYRKMSNALKVGSKEFSEKGIQGGIEKMSAMINEDSVWNRRWAVVKRIIKLREQEGESVDNTIVIQVPKTLKGKVNIQIKDK